MLLLNIYTKLINYKNIKQITFIMMTVWLSTAIYLFIMLCVDTNTFNIQGIIQMIMVVVLVVLWGVKGLTKKEATGYCQLIKDKKQYPSWQI